MRTLPTDIQDRIDLLNQTIHNNANPKMEAVIVKAIRNLNIQTLRSGSSIGSIDIALETDDSGEPYRIWIAGVVDKQVFISVYDIDETYNSPDSTFALSTEEEGAAVRDVAIEFDGTWTDGVLATDAVPWIFWVERGLTTDKIWAVQWDGVDVQPEATELHSVTR